jgi:hypothetical protein
MTQPRVPVPQGFKCVAPHVAHPVDGERGDLLVALATGHYVLSVYGTLRSVPQAWARDFARNWR